GLRRHPRAGRGDRGGLAGAHGLCHRFDPGRGPRSVTITGGGTRPDVEPRRGARTMTLNERANRVADDLERRAAELRVAVSRVGGARVIDCGGAVTGSLAAGLAMARACLGDIEIGRAHV